MQRVEKWVSTHHIKIWNQWILNYLTSSTFTWLRGAFPLCFCNFDSGGLWCKVLSNLFLLLLQKFFTSLSVLPGKYVAIFAHLFPNSACNSITTLSSSTENLQPLPLKNHTLQNLLTKTKQTKPHCLKITKTHPHQTERRPSTYKHQHTVFYG